MRSSSRLLQQKNFLDRARLAFQILTNSQGIPSSSASLSTVPSAVDEDKNKLRHEIVALQQKTEEMIQKEQKNLAELKQLSHQATLLQSNLDSAEAKLRQLSQGTHPLYGELLFQAGSKRIFATSPDRLVNKELFPTYRSQRLLNLERSAAIAKSLAQDDRFHGFPGMIVAYELEGEAAAKTKGHQVRGIVDGQHRVSAISIMLKNGTWPRDRKVLVEVHSSPDSKDAARLFQQVNKMVPVLEVDMVDTEALLLSSSSSSSLESVTEEKEGQPPPVLTAEQRAKQSIDHVAQELMNQFPKMFKPSLKCRAPHLNKDGLREDLFLNQHTFALAASQPDGAIKLKEYLLQQNDLLRESFSSSSLETDPVLEKAHANGFYLGMHKRWLL